MTNCTNGIRVARDGFVGTFTIDKPPVNAVSMFGLAPRVRM